MCPSLAVSDQNSVKSTLPVVRRSVITIATTILRTTRTSNSERRSRCHAPKQNRDREATRARPRAIRLCSTFVETAILHLTPPQVRTRLLTIPFYSFSVGSTLQQLFRGHSHYSHIHRHSQLYLRAPHPFPAAVAVAAAPLGAT